MFEDGLGDAEEEDNSYRLKRRFNKTAHPSFLIDDETMEKDIDIEVPVIPRKISKILWCLLKWDLARMKLKYSEQPSKIFEDDDDYALQPKEDYEEESQYPMGYYDTDFPNDEQQELPTILLSHKQQQSRKSKGILRRSPSSERMIRYLSITEFTYSDIYKETSIRFTR